MNEQKVFGVILLIFCLVPFCEPQLAFVIELFRHGARGAESNYWTASEQPFQKGQLFPSGMRQHYILGQKLRKQYIQDNHFLSKNYNFTELWVRSTDVNRTLMSAGSHLYGLYPPGTGPELPANLTEIYQIPPYREAQPFSAGLNALPNAYQPIPINTVNILDDPLLMPWAMCGKYYFYYYQKRFYQTKLFKKLKQEFKQTTTDLSTILGKKIKFKDLEGIFDVFISDYYENWPLPQNLTQELWNNITFLDSFWWFYHYSGQKEEKLMSTPLLNLYIQNLDNIVAGKQNYPSQWVMLSGHDINLAQMMTTLNVSSWKCVYDQWFSGQTDALNCFWRPYYASSLILELHENETKPNSFYVMLQYNGDYVNLCQQASTTCDYTEFRARIQNTVVKNFKKQCSIWSLSERQTFNTLSNAIGYENDQTNVIVLLIFSVALFAAIVFIMKILFKKNDKNKLQQYNNYFAQTLSSNNQGFSALSTSDT